jgi:RNA polymerase sigma-70 factor (ECF subfamily)
MSSVTVVHVASEALGEELERIFREHYPLVYRTAYSVTGSPQDAEDIVQSLFLQLVRLGFPDGLKASPKAYLYRATVNLSLNAVKLKRRQVPIADVERIEAAAHDTAGGSDPELKKRLVDAMAQLNPRAVEILILHYEHEYSDAQIAKLLGTSRGVIAVTLYRTRARLKKLLGEKYDNKARKHR